MDHRRLSAMEAVALIGGAILAIAIFLPWFGIDTPRNSIAGHTAGTVTGSETFPILRWLLLAAALAPVILAWVLLRGHKLSWPRGEMTAVVAIAAIGLIAYNSIIDKPGEVQSLTSLKGGVFVALFGALLMLAGSASRASQVERPRKPPGTI